MIPVKVASMTYVGGSMRVEALTEERERIALFVRRDAGSFSPGALANVGYERNSFMVLPKAELSEEKGLTR
jgi:hypothetical protein